MEKMKIAKTEKKKVVVEVSEQEVLQEMGMAGLFAEWQLVKSANKKNADAASVQEEALKLRFEEALVMVGADTIKWDCGDGHDWLATQVQQGEETYVVDKDRFMHNLGLIGKLSAKKIAEIKKASEVKKAGRKGYMLITVPKKD